MLHLITLYGTFWSFSFTRCFAAPFLFLQYGTKTWYPIAHASKQICKKRERLALSVSNECWIVPYTLASLHCTACKLFSRSRLQFHHYVSFNSYPDYPPGTAPGICTEKIPGPRAFDSQFFPGPRAFDKPRDIQNVYSIYCIWAWHVHYSCFGKTLLNLNTGDLSIFGFQFQHQNMVFGSLLDILNDTGFGSR